MDDIQAITNMSPVRVLEKMISGGLAAGDLGVTMARAGVGKTAFLIQIGLDALMRETTVLHVAVGQNTDHVRAWYDAFFDELVGHGSTAEIRRSDVMGRRVIQTYADGELTPQRLERTVELFLNHTQFKPGVVLIDGFDWENQSVVVTAAALGGFKSCAQRLGAALWMSAQTHRIDTPLHPRQMTQPCDTYVELVDVAVFLEPEGREVNVRILKDHEQETVTDMPLLINCDTFSLATEVPAAGVTLPVAAYTLLSGGAKGAEAAFGECAQRWGLQEINYTFDGHTPVRDRGLIRLSLAELEQGRVSDRYITAQMHRTYPDTQLFRNVLQSIWHQVNTSGEVFAVGTIQPDKTVRGGTGWAAELARHWHKPIHVFDQEKLVWFKWGKDDWNEVENPVISRTRFAGSGTRFLNDEGREAIRKLFVRSFGEL